MFCPKCGTKIEEGGGFCTKCGNEINTTDIDVVESSIDETPPKKKRISKKIIIPVSAIIVILLAVVVIFFGMKNPSEKSGYFANIPWGTDIETVKEKVDKIYGDGKSAIGRDKNEVISIIENYEGVPGLTACITLKCKDNGALYRVHIMFRYKDKSEYSEFTNTLIEKYNNLLGEANYEKDYLCKWTAEKSTIELFLDALGTHSFFLDFEEKN